MAYCSNCGTEISDGAKFCPKCGTPTDGKAEQTKSVENKKADDNDWKYGCAFWFFLILVLGYFVNKCSDDESSTKDDSNVQNTEQVDKKADENAHKKQEEVRHDFFEKGYEYSASYRIQRKQGWGISANFKYKIKIYNDGTTEIVEEIIGDDEFIGHPSELYSCKINKKSESYRDVAATWYEIEFNRNSLLYVDNDGNVISLNENGNNKTIQEAITSGDCRYGRFSKSKLNTSKVYRCKTCGKEYNPDKEAIVSEEYCYMDYPQKCNSCGKTYTVRQEGNGACKGTCEACYHKHQAVKIYEDVTGRTIH